METFKFKGKKFEIVKDIYTNEELKSLENYKHGLCESKDGVECSFINEYNNDFCLSLMGSKKIPNCVQYENVRYHCVFKKI